MTKRLIEEWLPIAELGIESVRERTPMTPFPAPNRLHVWWARRPLVASRAAVLASLLPADADRSTFMHMLGIHGDPVAAKKRIAKATREGVRLGADGLQPSLQPLPHWEGAVLVGRGGTETWDRSANGPRPHGWWRGDPLCGASAGLHHLRQ